MTTASATSTSTAPGGPGWSTLKSVAFLAGWLAAIFALILPFCTY